MNRKVLIVDDSGLTRRTLRQILESAGCEVIEAEEGLAALERYVVDRPDVVFLDLVMRGMYGMEVLQKLREIDTRARIVVVSADVQTSSQNMADAAGAKAFINKPFDKAQILVALDAAFAGEHDA
jgi:two-component system, chemotaxis family, chemotaxis protein CheY